MSDETVLFEITEKHLNTGLRRFPVGRVRTSRVDPQEGVSYVGYPIADLANLDPEAAIYLLYNKRLPSADEMADCKNDLAQRAPLILWSYKPCRHCPGKVIPEWLINGLTLLGMTGKAGDFRDGLNLIAEVPSSSPTSSGSVRMG